MPAKAPKIERVVSEFKCATAAQHSCPGKKHKSRSRVSLGIISMHFETHRGKTSGDHGHSDDSGCSDGRNSPQLTSQSVIVAGSNTGTYYRGLKNYLYYFGGSLLQV